jgi:ribosome-binding factor A
VSHRLERVAEQIRAALADAIRDDVRDTRVGFVTLTEVAVSPDLKQARVYVSRLGSPSDRTEAVAALNRAAPFLRRALARRARLKFTPSIRFVEDATIERGSRVEAIIQEIHAEDGGADGSSGEEG